MVAGTKYLLKRYKKKIYETLLWNSHLLFDIHYQQKLVQEEENEGLEIS